MNRDVFSDLRHCLSRRHSGILSSGVVVATSTDDESSMQVSTQEREWCRLVGARIREQRNHSGLTLKALATTAGVHFNAISKIENGESVAKRATLEKLCTALGISLEQLQRLALPKAPEHDAVVLFLEGFRTQFAEEFENVPSDWRQAMWSRFVELGKKMGIANADAAQYFMGQLKREMNSIFQLQALIDAGKADPILGKLTYEFEHLNSSLRKPSTGSRIDPPHSGVSPLYSVVSTADAK